MLRQPDRRLPVARAHIPRAIVIRRQRSEILIQLRRIQRAIAGIIVGLLGEVIWKVIGHDLFCHGLQNTLIKIAANPEPCSGNQIIQNGFNGDNKTALFRLHQNPNSPMYVNPSRVQSHVPCFHQSGANRI